MRLKLRLVGVLGLLGCFVLAGSQPRGLQAQPAVPNAHWIWTAEATVQSAPDGIRYFRKSFKLDAVPPEATLKITADNTFRVWLNGSEVGTGNEWQNLSSYKVGKLLKAGENVLAVEAGNEGDSPAGLLVILTAKADGKTTTVVSDESWKTAKTADKGWEKPGFVDAKWDKAKVLAPLGGGPWGNFGQAVPGSNKAGTFTVPEGFKVEKVVAPNVELADGKALRLSLVNMCMDSKGRIYVAQENGPILICTEPSASGECKKIAVYCDQIRNCHGMCWVNDSFYLVGDGPKGTGLYRCRDSKNAGRIDTVEPLAKFNGGMGEHGPHAVIHGPDDKLYLIVGNHSALVVDKLAANSPLKRWPNGQQGPDQGQPGTTEDVLLKRQNDANGHAAGIRAPGGTIWRMDLDGKNPALVAAGFRNAFDIAFNPEGELFTFDSDMEWDEALPWYRPVRVCHAIPGAEFGWRTGASKIPAYSEDTLPAVIDTGRGSPTGVTFYDHAAFPAKYRGAFFMCDWSIGVLWAIHLKHEGGSYRAEAEKFCTGSPMPITDCLVGQDGAIYFSVGGRGSQGGVYRIVATGPPSTAKPEPEHPAIRLRRLGESNEPNAEPVLRKALTDTDPWVRRVACEALIRRGIEPPVKELLPLLADADPFVRTAARLVLQRIEPATWAADLLKDPSDRIAEQAIIALCKTGQAAKFAEPIFARLAVKKPERTPAELLAWTRTIQLACVHTRATPGPMDVFAQQCLALFPHSDALVNRELAILLAEFARTGELKDGVVPKLMTALKAAKADRPQQIHYFYCLRVIPTGWTPEEKADLLAWYDGTKTWTGGASFTRYLENILTEMNGIFTTQDRTAALAEAGRRPLSALILLRNAPADQLPSAKELLACFEMLGRTPGVAKVNELRTTLIEALGKSQGADVDQALRSLPNLDPAQRAAVAKALLKHPTPENLPFIVRGFDGANANNLPELLAGVQKNPGKPKPDDGASYRSLLMSSKKIPEKDRWKIVQVLRQWSNNKQFGAKEGDWQTELASWSKWFNQSFPMQPAVPDLISDASTPSKYQFNELAKFLTTDPKGKNGDVARGKLAFTKAQCIKCHRYGNEGEGLGPDLSAVSKRFKRAEILESILYPSKVISDQYRSTKVTTLDGKNFNGLLAQQGDTVTMLLQDGSKVMFKAGDIEECIASLISVMPEKLLDELTLTEIADLFAFLETEPKK